MGTLTLALSRRERGQRVCARRCLVDRDDSRIIECTDDARATLSRTLDFKCRTNHTGAVMHDTQPHPVQCRYLSGKAHAVIMHHERQTPC